MGVGRIDGEASLEGSRLMDEDGIKVEMKDAVVLCSNLLWNSRSERQAGPSAMVNLARFNDPRLHVTP